MATGCHGVHLHHTLPLAPTPDIPVAGDSTLVSALPQILLSVAFRYPYNSVDEIARRGERAQPNRGLSEYYAGMHSTAQHSEETLALLCKEIGQQRNSK